MYSIVILPHFKKVLKPYAKKHRAFVKDIIETLKAFRKENCISLGRGFYKIRLKVSGMSKGKSKSFRLVVFLIEIEKMLVPVTIFSKSDRDSISKKELNDELDEILFELRSQHLLN